MTTIESAPPGAAAPVDAAATLTPVPAAPSHATLIDFEGIAAIWWRDVLRFGQQRVRLLGGLMRSLVWIVALGLGLRGSFRPVEGLDYAQFIFPGVIAMAIIFAALQSAISIIWDREFGFLKEVLVAPVARSTVPLGKVLGGATVSGLQGLVVLPLVLLVGLRPSIEGVLLAILFMGLTALAMTGIGILIAARMSDFEGFGVIQNFVAMPLYLLSGAMFPVTGAPAWLQVLVAINPLAFGVDGVRGALTGYWYHPGWLDALALVLVTGLTLGLASWLFDQEGR